MNYSISQQWQHIELGNEALRLRSSERDYRPLPNHAKPFEEGLFKV